MNDWFDAEAHADRALEMYERGRWAEAEAELRKALSLNPEQPEWHFNLGLTLEAAGRDADALACYERVIDLEPEGVEAVIAAGAVCSRMDRVQHALVWLDRALKLEPRAEAAYSHKIDCLIRLNRHEEAETTFYLAQHILEEPSASCFAVIAESLIRRKIFDRAEWCLREALRLEPGMPRLRARLAAVLAATGRHQRALHLYIRDLRDDPGNLETLLDLGDLLIQVGRLPEAAEKLRRVLEIEPANVDAHFRLGCIAMASRRFEQAHLEFELVLKLDSLFPLIRLWLGEALLRLGRKAEAQACLHDVIEQVRGAPAAAKTPEDSAPAASDGHSPESEVPIECDFPKLGELLLDADMPAPAAEMFELALRDLPPEPVKRAGRAELLRRLALARFRAGDRDGGAAASRRVIRLDPQCIKSVHNLALAALEQERLRMAAGWIRRGLKIDRHDDGLRRLRMKLWLRTLAHSARRPIDRVIDLIHSIALP